MSATASDFLVQRLYEWGVRRIFGYPGDGINGVMGALRRFKKIDFFQARHEELAAFMATAHAKFTGETGVCIATSGPGAIHLLNGLYDAKLDHMPVVAIVGQQATTALGTFYQQEVDLMSLFKDVCNYVNMASNAAQIRHLVDNAFRVAQAERAVTCIILPNDVQEMDAVEAPQRKHGTSFTGVGYTRPEIVPTVSELHRAAEVLNAGERVAMLVGAGANHATDELMEAADLLGAGVAKALLGKAALPDDLPYVTGSIGLLGTKPSWRLMMECDTLLMIGTGFPYSEFLPGEGQARGVQIDIDARQLNLRYPMEVALHGDSVLTLRALLPLLKRKDDRRWQQGLVGMIKEWWEVMEGRALLDADPINPQRLFWELSPRLPKDCILTNDSGSSTNWFARDVRMQRGMMASLSGGLATMCPGVPYALAAKMAYPKRPVICMIGDGAMEMLGNNGMITVAEHWREWENPTFIVLVLDNHDLNQVTWEQRVMNGDPKFEKSQILPEFPFARYAQMLGLKGIEVNEPTQIVPAWESALHADRPVIIDAHTDPEVPPLPPHITLEQAKGYMSSIIKGDPNRVGMIKQSAKQMMKTFLPK